MHVARKSALVTVLWMQAALPLIGCGPKLEEETAKYERRVAALGQHMQRHPPFRTHLTAAVSEARAIRRLARQVQDPEKKAELMAQANRRMHSDLAVELDRIEPATRGILQTVRALQALPLNSSDRERAANQAREARQTIRETSKELAKADVGTPRLALKQARAANRRLSDALEELQALQRIFETRVR